MALAADVVVGNEADALLYPATPIAEVPGGGDVNQSMIEAASFGRDCDTTASLAGSVAEAMQGASAIRQDWIETVERANVDFFEEVEGDRQANFRSMAQRLVEAPRAEVLGDILRDRGIS